MKTAHFILMADIINSRDLDQADTMGDFFELVNFVNKEWKANILSPLTITLGDEFQGVISGQDSVADVIFALEERAVKLAYGFKLRYVIYEGSIDTKINKKIAYGMMGDGLTRAREKLGTMKRTANRFNFYLMDEAKSQALNDIFLLFQGIVDNWEPDHDSSLITAFLETENYKDVAKEVGRDRSSIWRRRRSLRVREYLATKRVIVFLLSPKNE